MSDPGQGAEPKPAGRAYEGDRYKAEYEDSSWLAFDDWRQNSAEREAGDYSREQGTTLATGQQFRSGLNPSDQLYEGQPHSELIRMVTENLSPGDVDKQGRIWNAQGDALHTFSNDLAAAANKEGAHWQGPAADAAHGFFKQLGGWAQHTGDGAYLASNRFSQSSAAAEHARNSMPAEVPFDRQAEVKNGLQQLNSGNAGDALQTFNGMEAKQRASMEAHQQAVQVMNTYDQTLYGTNSQHPSFNRPPEMGASDSTHASSAFSAPSGATAAPFSGGGAPVVGGGAPGPVAGPAGAAGAGPLSPGGATGAGAMHGYGGPNTPSGTSHPVPRNPAAGFGGGAMTGGGSGLGSLGSETYRGKPGRIPAGGSAAGRVTGGGGKGISERLAGGKVPASEAAERAGGTGKGSGAAAPGKGAPGEAIARGGAAASGKGGPGALGGAPGGAGKREEDKEKKAPTYLQEDDADELFGGSYLEQKPTPPVIGE